MGAAPPLAPAGSFEFDEGQNRVIEGVASSMRFVGNLLYVYTALALLGAVGHGVMHRIPEAISTGLGGILYGVMGASISKASGFFKQIVTTQGNDVPHLMNALSHLGALFKLIRTLVLILLCLVLFAFVVGIAVGIAKH